MKTLDIATYLSILDTPSYFDMRLLPNNIKEKTDGTEIFIEAIKYPYKKILENASLEYVPQKGKGKGINVITGKTVNMIKEGIIDPLLVTKSALKNAVSVASTILSTDCIISNMREE